MNYKLREKVKLIYQETPINKLEKISEKYGVEIFIKRDDLTGMVLSGNKVRKLEYVLKDAMDRNSEVIITAGAIQSNHARATAIACRKLGLEPHLLLRGNEPSTATGNLLLDKIVNSKIEYLDPTEFANIEAYAESVINQYSRLGKKAYWIPIGASNGIGNLGYINAYNEIIAQTIKDKIDLSAIICTVGSGGTYSGLVIGSACHSINVPVYGYSVGGSSKYFYDKCNQIIKETLDLVNCHKNLDLKLDISDDYQGPGYAIPYPEVIDTIKEVALLEGIILDPVYTGKAFHGLLSDIKSGKFTSKDKILFIHTGGQFGLEPFESLFK